MTGAAGFVGRALVQRLTSDGMPVRAGGRSVAPARSCGGLVEAHITPDLGPSADWSAAVEGIDVVVHCAARVHVLDDRAADPDAAFRKDNVEGTAHLARTAAKAGVRRFVLVSSIGVNGAFTPGDPFTAGDVPAPSTPYARSKRDAERALASVSAETGLEVVIVRPPLVYGPAAPGNFATLLRAIQRGLPLPLASIRNQRSFVGLNNLVDLLARCSTHARAPGRTFLVCDGEDLSTPELVRRIARAFDRPARLVQIPPSWLMAASRWLGHDRLGEQLCESLRIDQSATTATLDWHPPSTVDDELGRMAQKCRSRGSESVRSQSVP